MLEKQNALMAEVVFATSQNGFGPGSDPYKESMYAFFKRSRLQNAIGHMGASLFTATMATQFIGPKLAICYLVIHQVLMWLVTFTFYSKWTNERIDANGLPKYVLQSNFLAKTFLTSIVWLNVPAEMSYTFCLIVFVVAYACAAGTMVTLGPLRRFARQDLYCMLLPVAFASLHYDHVFVGLGTLFFLVLIASAGLDEMHNTYAELVSFRFKSLRNSEILDHSNRQLTTAIEELEAEAEKRKELQDEQEKLQQNLLLASREAGKAEIATGVLHNVGNVMNSVNVSSNLMLENMQNGLQAKLASALKLLEEHENDLSGFFQNDQRGSHFIPFVRELNDQAKSILTEIEDLQHNVAHVNSVVAAQQSHASSAGLISKVGVQETVQASLQIVSQEFKQHRIAFEQAANVKCEVETDQQKLIQILVNLFQNAKHAIVDMDPTERKVTVDINTSRSEIEIIVSDTGIGITNEHLNKIFQHGFSTRKGRGGSGIGLHHSFLLLEEMGGNLRAASDGPGTGSSFTITLPARISEAGCAMSHNNNQSEINCNSKAN